MRNFIYPLLIVVVTSCSAMYYTVGDRDNPNERFSNIPDGVAFYRTLDGNKAFAANIGVQNSYPYATTLFGYGGFCHSKDTSDEAIECALQQCQKNVNGINQYGGYGSFVKDCALMFVNENSLWANSTNDFDVKKGNSIREARLREYNYQIAEQKRKRELEEARRQQRIAQIEAQKKAELDRQLALWTNYINQTKAMCVSYGFTEENAIASCVQTEINNEIMRMQQAQAYANAQARSNAARRNQALSNMGRCLSTEGSFSACSNAWNGYTPPKTTVCEFDAFGNKITSTCRTQ